LAPPFSKVDKNKELVLAPPFSKVDKNKKEVKEERSEKKKKVRSKKGGK
jgi:hypothetical protein